MVVGSLPSLGEMENILRMLRLNADALIRIQTAVMSQQRAPTEQIAQFGKLEPEKDRQMHMYQKEVNRAGASAGLGLKKRRGVSAAQNVIPH